MLPRQPMIPRLMQQILKWLTYWISSVLIQIVTKIPTICLLATRLYFIWFRLEKELLKVSSSSSSEEKSTSLKFGCCSGQQKSLLCLLSSSAVQLHDFNLLLLSVLKVLLIFLREGFAKKSDPLPVVVRFRVTFDGLFKDWLTKDSHFAAGSLSSITSTFPAFKGTISWKLIVWKNN